MTPEILELLLKYIDEKIGYEFANRAFHDVGPRDHLVALEAELRKRVADKNVLAALGIGGF